MATRERPQVSGIEQELAAVEVELLSVESEIIKLSRQKEILLKRREKLCDDALIEKSKLLASQNWSRTDHVWSNEVDSIRKSVFKLESFRDHQLPTINAILSEKDVILLMPTGGGKSLCYQLAALYFSGLTLVVSPLLALMEDQIMGLKTLKVSATLLSSNSTKEEINHIQQEMVNKNSTMKLLYVTPEKLAKSKRFMSKLQKCYQQKGLSLIAIDEVHCCSQWGHDFRPDYKYLGVLKAMFPDVPLLGVTATATSHVLVDVQKMLNIQGCLVIKAHFNRPNLYYEIREKSSVYKECVEQLDTLLKKRYAGKSGIIYTTTIKDCEDLNQDLRKLGNAVGCYHAQLDAEKRSKVHSMWLSGKYQAVIATVAFGLGIDKPDVRFVIHHCLSKSMENYYQESGRAGRDNQPADCILFYRLADTFRISTMVYAQQVALEKLYNMVAYCIDNTRCRREMIASQFEEQWESRDCNEMCDHCRQPRVGEEIDITSYCRGVYDILAKGASMEKRLTSQMVIDAWLDKGPVELRVATIKKLPILRAEAILAHLLVESFLQEDFQISPYKANTYIRRGPRAAAVSSGKHRITMIVGGPKRHPSSTAATRQKDSTSSAACKPIQENKNISVTHSGTSNTNIDALNERSKISKKLVQISSLEAIEKHVKCSSNLLPSTSIRPHQESKSDLPRNEMKRRKEPTQKNSKHSGSRVTQIVDLCDSDDLLSVEVKRKSVDCNGALGSSKRTKANY